MWANRVLPPQNWGSLLLLHLVWPPSPGALLQPPDLRPASRKGKGRKMEKGPGAEHLSSKEVPQSFHTALLLNSPCPEPNNMTILSYNGNSEMPLWFFKLCSQLTYLGVITGKRGANEHWQTTSKLPWAFSLLSLTWCSVWDLILGRFREDFLSLFYPPYTTFLSTTSSTKILILLYTNIFLLKKEGRGAISGQTNCHYLNYWVE